MWYSVDFVGDPKDGKVEWARKQWRPEAPPDLPQFLDWSEPEWEAWLQRKLDVLSIFARYGVARGERGARANTRPYTPNAAGTATPLPPSPHVDNP